MKPCYSPHSPHSPHPEPFRRDETARQHGVTDGVADRVGWQIIVRIDHLALECRQLVVAGPWTYIALALPFGFLAAGIGGGGLRIALGGMRHLLSTDGRKTGILMNVHSGRS